MLSPAVAFLSNFRVPTSSIAETMCVSTIVGEHTSIRSPIDICPELRRPARTVPRPVIEKMLSTCISNWCPQRPNAKLQLAGLSVPLSVQLTKARFGPPVSWKFMLGQLFQDFIVHRHEPCWPSLPILSSIRDTSFQSPRKWSLDRCPWQIGCPRNQESIGPLTYGS